MHKATRHLSEIGALRKYGAGGLSVIDPERVLLVFAVGRDLVSETIATTTPAGADKLLGGLDRYAIGGTDAAIYHLGGINNIADLGQRIVYIPQFAELPELPDGDSVRVLRMDSAAEHSWTTGYCSVAQTYADLFAQPGWQASEFRRELWRKLFSIDDWIQQGFDNGSTTD